MRVIEARLANGQITPIPLPHELEPFQLDPAVRQQFSKLLSQTPTLSAVDSVIAKTPAAGTTQPSIAMPAPGSSLWDWMHPAAPASAQKTAAPLHWDHPVFLSQAGIAASARITVSPGRTAKPISWRGHQAAYIPQKNAPGLWIRPLPVSETTLANVNHIVSLGQIAVEPFSQLHAPYAESIGAAFDVGAAFVAVAEIYQQASRPKEMTPLKKTLFYLKRLAYIATGATHIAPLPGGDSVRLVGVILKALDKGCDELSAMKFRERTT
jgi:hypothetical protein